jgi:hypothetical protein
MIYPVIDEYATHHDLSCYGAQTAFKPRIKQLESSLKGRRSLLKSD